MNNRISFLKTLRGGGINYCNAVPFVGNVLDK